MQELLVNTIVEWADTPTPRYDRILALDPSLACVVVIDVTNIDDDDAVNPVVLTYAVLLQALRTSKASIVEKDPYLEKLHLKILLTDQEKRDLKKIWEIIEPIILHDDVFNPKVRAELVRSAVESSGRDPKMVRLLERRADQTGIASSLLPLWDCKTERKRKALPKIGQERRITRCQYGCCGRRALSDWYQAVLRERKRSVSPLCLPEDNRDLLWPWEI
jgi:hypothetical protein